MRRRQPEAAIQRALVLHLQARAWPDVEWWHHPAGGYRRPAEARVMVGLGTVAGIPDLLAVRCGNLFCLELKSPAGRLTEAQAAMIARLERSRCGDPHTRSLEFIEGLQRMSDRARLPNRRYSETFNFDCGQHRFTASISYFPGTNQVAEIFLGNGRAGSDVDAAAKDSAVVASIALQHGVPIDVLRHALLRDARGVASSPLGVALDILAVAGARP